MLQKKIYFKMKLTIFSPILEIILSIFEGKKKTVYILLNYIMEISLLVFKVIIKLSPIFICTG
jgi:hypothetical protein